MSKTNYSSICMCICTCKCAELKDYEEIILFNNKHSKNNITKNCKYLQINTENHFDKLLDN